MGTAYLDGRPIGDDGRDAFGRPDIGASAASHATAAIDEADARFVAAASALIPALVRNAARRFPDRLHLIPGLDRWSTPKQIIAVCDSLKERAEMARRSGFGREVDAITLAGARLYARETAAIPPCRGYAP